MQHELNLELDNSRDKVGQKTNFTVFQRCTILTTQQVRLKASERLSLILSGILPQVKFHKICSFFRSLDITKHV